MVSHTAVKELMKSASQSHISQKAIFRMTELVEDFVKATTGAADNILEEQNKYREIQGLRPKKRLTEEEIEEVIRCTFYN